MKKLIAAGVVSVLLTGCAFSIKTPVVANYANLDKIDGATTRNDVALHLGTPQATGIHFRDGVVSPLQFYYGLAGRFTLSSAQMDSGMAFITLGSDKVSDAIYFRSKRNGVEVKLNDDLSIKRIADRTILGSSKIDDVFQALGRPAYEGRRLNTSTNIQHTLAFWDASQMQQKGAIKEKWLLIGYDNDRVVQDMIWVSSYPEDIQALGSVTEQQLRQMSRTVIAGFIPVPEPTGMSSGTKIDAVQVDALLATKPKTVQEIETVLGKPSALGIKSFLGETPISLSNWSHSFTEMKGEEQNFYMYGATEEERNAAVQSSYMVMQIDQSRLMVGHTSTGEIKEILWFRPNPF